MKAFLAAFVALLVCGTIRADDEPKAESKTVSFADATEAPAEGSAVAASGRRKLGDRDARRFGITLASTRAALKELKASGVIDGTESSSELAVVVADHIASKSANKAAYEKVGAPDWDSIFAFLEKLIAFIMKFFAF